MNNLSLSQAIAQALTAIDRLDAQLLLSHVLSKPKSYLISWPDQVLTEDQLKQFNDLVSQRAQGYPLAYLTGIKSFWDMDLQVTPDVLIPRPDTELLVELALSRLNPGMDLLELGTGSGAIACALARENPTIRITATDQSDKALTVARSNAEKYGLRTITFIRSDWFASLAGQSFHLIVSNPPYLSETDPHLSTDIRFEPRSALVSGQTGEEDYQKILSQASLYLKPHGWILLEHGSTQAEQIRVLLAQHSFQDIETVKDLSGHDRVTLACRGPLI